MVGYGPGFRVHADSAGNPAAPRTDGAEETGWSKLSCVRALVTRPRTARGAYGVEQVGGGEQAECPHRRRLQGLPTVSVARIVRDRRQGSCCQVGAFASGLLLRSGGLLRLSCAVVREEHGRADSSNHVWGQPILFGSFVRRCQRHAVDSPLIPSHSYVFVAAMFGGIFIETHFLATALRFFGELDWRRKPSMLTAARRCRRVVRGSRVSMLLHLLGGGGKLLCSYASVRGRGRYRCAFPGRRRILW